MADSDWLTRRAFSVIDSMRCCNVIKVLAVGFTFWCTYVTIGYVDRWAGAPTLWSSMEVVNSTLAEDTVQDPPDNPMYAGGIAVLVAFVLFMYWGSLNEKVDLKDDDEKNKKEDSRMYDNQGISKIYKRTKHTGVFSVSDAMTKQLLPKRGRDRPHAVDCEKCLLRAQEIRTQGCPYGLYVLGKSTYQSNRMRDTRSTGSVRSEDHIQKQLRRTRRAHSSPEIIVSRRDAACTCLGVRQNGGGPVVDTKKQNWMPVYRDKSIPRTSDDDCERTVECAKERCGCATDVTDTIRYEKEAVQRLAEFETSYQSVLRRKGEDYRSSSIQHSAEEIRSLLGERSEDEMTTNGRIKRQLDDAFVRLEDRPDVRIAIVAESVV